MIWFRDPLGVFSVSSQQVKLNCKKSNSRILLTVAHEHKQSDPRTVNQERMPGTAAIKYIKARKNIVGVLFVIHKAEEKRFCNL